VSLLGWSGGGRAAYDLPSFHAAKFFENLKRRIGKNIATIRIEVEEVDAVGAVFPQVPRCPTELHFGDKDTGIPLTDVEAIRAKRPEVEIHIYSAGHGFHCDERASYDAPAARLAWDRSLAFLAKHMKS
jgi:dienelactone hydrolase